jgi:hypothetical protein
MESFAPEREEGAAFEDAGLDPILNRFGDREYERRR